MWKFVEMRDGYQQYNVVDVRAFSHFSHLHISTFIHFQITLSVFLLSNKLINLTFVVLNSYF